MSRSEFWRHKITNTVILKFEPGFLFLQKNFKFFTFEFNFFVLYYIYYIFIFHTIYLLYFILEEEALIKLIYLWKFVQ